jgi:hypothetical protein
VYENLNIRDLQSTTQETIDRATRTLLILGMNSDAPEGLTLTWLIFANRECVVMNIDF